MTKITLIKISRNFVFANNFWFSAMFRQIVCLFFLQYDVIAIFAKAKMISICRFCTVLAKLNTGTVEDREMTCTQGWLDYD
jgi:hypothetical protein